MHKGDFMFDERKVPALCLKLGVKACLYNGKKEQLKSAPYKNNGITMIPADALGLLGIKADADTALNAIDGYYKNENEMGLIFISDNENDVALTVTDDLTYMLSLANAFIFDIPRVKMSKSYAPATEDEMRGFLEVGNLVTDLLVARKNTRPYILSSKQIFNTLKEIYASKDGSYEYDCIVKLIQSADESKQHFPELLEDGTGFKEPFPASGYVDEYDAGGRHTNTEYYTFHLRRFAFAYHLTGDEKYARMEVQYSSQLD